jgi:hypothetical protein
MTPKNEPEQQATTGTERDPIHFVPADDLTSTVVERKETE